jgi:hypothetical protein
MTKSLLLSYNTAGGWVSPPLLLPCPQLPLHSLAVCMCVYLFNNLTQSMALHVSSNHQPSQIYVSGPVLSLDSEPYLWAFTFPERSVRYFQLSVPKHRQPFSPSLTSASSLSFNPLSTLLISLRLGTTVTMIPFLKHTPPPPQVLLALPPAYFHNLPGAHTMVLLPLHRDDHGSFSGL